VDVVTSLIQAGGDVNKKDGDGWTPLHNASNLGNVEVITALLAAGADKTIKNDDGETPHNVARDQDTWNALNAEGTVAYGLHEASRFGNLEVVNSLIQAGRDVNSQDVAGWTPLHHASMKGHVEVIIALLAAGADKTIKNKWGGTPRGVANKEESKYPLEYPLHYASEYGNVEVIKSLIQAGGDVNCQNESDFIPTHYASENSNVTVGEWLVGEGWTPLHSASHHGHAEVIIALLAAGADKNKKNEKYGTPLHVASENGHVEVVKKLIEACGEVNTQRSSDGSTPLHCASYNGHVEVITASQLEQTILSRIEGAERLLMLQGCTQSA